MEFQILSFPDVCLVALGTKLGALGIVSVCLTLNYIPHGLFSECNF